MWVEHIAAKVIRNGGGVWVENGALRWSDRPAARRAKSHGLTGDPLWDRDIRRSLLGGVDDDELDE